MRSGTIGALLGLLAGAGLEPSPWLLSAGALVPVVGAVWSQGAGRILLLTLALGWSWAGADAWQRRQAQLPLELTGRDLQLNGRIVGLPEVRQAFGRPGRRFLFEVQACSVPTGSGDCTGLRRVRLSWYGAPPLAAGEHWRLSVRLKPPRGRRNPGGFDYARYLYRRGIDATGYVRRYPAAERLSPARGWPALREGLARRLQRELAPYPQGRWLRALALADQRGLDEADWERLRGTGSVHLFVVSGLHIGLIGGLLFLSVRNSGRLFAPGAWLPLLALISALTGAAGYAALAGWGLPAQRAWLMFAAGALLWWGRRVGQPLWLLLMVAVVVLTVQPVAVWAPGFWLSFIAVAVILVALRGHRPQPGAATGLLRMQWAVWLGLLVPLALSGAPLTWVAFPANLLAVPLVSLLVLPANLAALLALPWWPAAAQLLWQVADAVMSAVQAWLTLCAQWQGEGWYPARSPPGVWLLAVMGCVLALLPRGWPGRWLAPLLLAPLLWWQPPGPAPGEWRATVLDVGQGLAVLVETARHRLLYDAGPRYGSFDSGARIVLPYLRYRGHGALDLLLLSHGDNDHAGGALSVAQTLPVARVLSGEPVSGLAPASRCRRGQRWNWDGVEFRVLYPPAPGATGNAGSCVLAVAGGGHSLLLSGDIGHAQERRLLNEVRRWRGGALVAPHHGSRHSSGAAWVKALRPAEVVFSSGWRNRFGHPHPEVRERYRRIGARLWSTADHGAVHLLTRDGQLHVETAR